MTECLDILVIFTDNSNHLFSIDPKIIVKLFKEIVAQTIDLKDEHYFGFCIKDEREATYWLCDEKSLISHEYFKGTSSNIKVYFLIKYFYEIQNIISDEVVKYYLYHQLKNGVYSGDIECDSNRCFELLAMTLCIEEIKFQNFCEQTKKMSIIPLHLFSKHPSIEHCIWKIEEKYSQLVSHNCEDLMERFISLIFELPTEVTHYFLSKDFNSSPSVIGINQSGFIECNEKSKSSYKLIYTWPEIVNITSNKNRIFFEIQDSSQNRTSLRRKSCASCISYEVSNSHLAKSIVYLAKDTIDFISSYRDFSASTLKSTQYKSEKRNMSYFKKFNSNTSSRKEKYRAPIPSIFSSECSVDISRSPSRISISSSTFNESCITNDSTSLHCDNDSLASNMTLQELKQKFMELCTKKNELQLLLNQKLAEAKELTTTEFTMTCKVPIDHKLFDPDGKVFFTKNPLPSRLLNPDNQSDYQNNKNRLLLQIETLTNIYEFLRKSNKAEKKSRKELDDRKREIDNIKNELRALETSHAADLGRFDNCRSNSVGNLNRLSSTLTDNTFSNGHITNVPNNRLTVKTNYLVPLTEPSQRKFKSENVPVISKTWQDETYPRIVYDHENILPRNQHHHHQAPTSNPYPNWNGVHSNPSDSNKSSFQRFHSARTIIRVPTSSDKIKDSFSNVEICNSFVDPVSGSISSTSRSSIDDVVINDSFDTPECSIEHTENDIPVTKIVHLRQSSVVNNCVNNCRDSMEINHSRLNSIDIGHSRRIILKSNKQNRRSTSLEDLREDEVSANVKYLERREQTPCPQSPYRNRVKYHPSIRDGRPANLTRGKTPTIIKKQAHSNSFDLR